MTLNKKFPLFLVLLLSACNVIQQTNPSVTELPTDSPWSKNGIVYEKPIWKMVKGEYGIDVVIPVKNNNNKPTDVSFHFELYSPSGSLISTCSTSNDRSSILVGDNSIVASNGTAKIQCTHSIYASVNESNFSSFDWKYGVIVTPLDENRPNDIQVLETGFEKTEEIVGIVKYLVYARIQSKSDQQVTTRFYVLDAQGVQFIGCETENELKADTVVQVECEVAYNTDKITESPASLIVDVIKWEQ